MSKYALRDLYGNIFEPSTTEKTVADPEEQKSLSGTTETAPHAVSPANAGSIYMALLTLLIFAVLFGVI